MKALWQSHVVQHFAVQIGTGALLALATYFAGADYSALGAFAGIAQAAAALALAGAHSLEVKKNP